MSRVRSGEGFAASELPLTCREWWQDLQRETDSELYDLGLFHLGRRLEREKAPELAARLYQALLQNVVAESTQRLAKDRLDALGISGRFAVEGFLEGLSTLARRPLPLLAMTAGSLAFQVGRAWAASRLLGSTASRFLGGFGARLTTHSFGFGLETAAYLGSLRALDPENPISLREGIRTALNFGVLRSIGAAFSRHPGLLGNVAVPVVGLYTAGFLEEAWKLHPQRNPGERLVSSLALFLQAQVGGRIAAGFLGPGIGKFFQELELRQPFRPSSANHGWRGQDGSRSATALTLPMGKRDPHPRLLTPIAWIKGRMEGGGHPAFPDPHTKIGRTLRDLHRELGRQRVELNFALLKILSGYRDPLALLAGKESIDFWLKSIEISLQEQERGLKRLRLAVEDYRGRHRLASNWNQELLMQEEKHYALNGRILEQLRRVMEIGVRPLDLNHPLVREIQFRKRLEWTLTQAGMDARPEPKNLLRLARLDASSAFWSLPRETIARRLLPNFHPGFTQEDGLLLDRAVLGPIRGRDLVFTWEGTLGETFTQEGAKQALVERPEDFDRFPLSEIVYQDSLITLPYRRIQAAFLGLWAAGNRLRLMVPENRLEELWEFLNDTPLLKVALDLAPSLDPLRPVTLEELRRSSYIMGDFEGASPGPQLDVLVDDLAKDLRAYRADLDRRSTISPAAGDILLNRLEEFFGKHPSTELIH